MPSMLSKPGHVGTEILTNWENTIDALKRITLTQRATVIEKSCRFSYR